MTYTYVDGKYVYIGDEDRIAELEAENAKLKRQRDIYWKDANQYLNDIGKLRAERDELREAAAWYIECVEAHTYLKCKFWKPYRENLDIWHSIDAIFKESDRALRALLEKHG